MAELERNFRPTFSFEIFPPNTQVGEEKLWGTIQQLSDLHPDYISVTCSNGNQRIEETTLRVADVVKNCGVETLVHLPARYLTQAQVRTILAALEARGIHQLLALRGDKLPNREPQADFEHASDLVAFIQAEAPQFSITGACYPEIHPEAASRVADIQFLKQKVDAGCQQLITQLFLDNELFYRFKENCALAGIEQPVMAGIMPIVNRKQALRLIKDNRIALPKKFLAILNKYEHDPISLKAAGIAYAVDQIVDLVAQNVEGIHLYTMNNPSVAQQIHQMTHPLFLHTEVS